MVFKNISDYLKEDAELVASSDEALQTLELYMAVAALLWEVALVDGRFRTREAQKIVSLLGKEFELGPELIAELLDTASGIRDDGRINYLISQLNQHLSLEQRRSMLEMAHRVALADEEFAKSEELLLGLLMKRLQIKE